MIEHLTELLELIFALLNWCNALFFIEHASEGIKICGVLYKAGDIDLCADEVTKVAAGV
jgi:hypothetical protein